jgi:hypothetical protein
VSFPPPNSNQALVRGHGSLPRGSQYTTSYEADLSRALVIWGAGNNAAALAAAVPTLAVGQQQLAPFCHSQVQRAALTLPGRDVAFVRGRITGNQVLSQRPGYINAILIQSRGVARVGDDSCFQCRTNCDRGPFPECRSLNGHFGGCCGNCKWRDYAARCTLTFVSVDNDDGPDSRADDNDEEDRTIPLIKSEAKDDGRGRKLLGGVDASGSGTQADPFVL